MKTLLANLKHAAINGEHLSIGGGIFTPVEISAALAELDSVFGLLILAQHYANQFDDASAHDVLCSDDATNIIERLT